MLSPDLMAQLWPLHIGIWIASVCFGGLIGLCLTNQTETRWGAALIQVAILASLSIGLPQLISTFSLLPALPDDGSADGLIRFYLDVTAYDWFLKSTAHIQLVLQSSAIALAVWITSGLAVMLARWEDAY